MQAFNTGFQLEDKPTLPMEDKPTVLILIEKRTSDLAIA